MDSLTQVALGAAVGEATLGRSLGNKAAILGGVFGTLPDLDILAYPFLNGMGELAFHRGYTHSFVVCTLFALFAGFLVDRWTRTETPTRKQWIWFFLLTLNTHWMIDTCTTYGTQIFQPFSDYPASTNSIFIIDPLYTVPLLLGVSIALFFNRTSVVRRRLNYAGLVLSTAYVILGLGIQQHAAAVFEDVRARQHIDATQSITMAGPLTTLLWVHMADTGDSLYVGLYSLLDEAPPSSLSAYPKHPELLEGWEDQAPVQRALWFTRGYHVVSVQQDTLVIHDARLGRSDLWMGDGGQYNFNFWMLPSATNPDSLVDLDLRNPSIEVGQLPFDAYVDRVLGR